MDFRILGALEVRHGGALVPLGGPRHRRLLAILLLSADEVVSAGRLVEALWGDDPPSSAPAMVHVRISELRSALRVGRPAPDAGIASGHGGYALRLNDDELDARRFAELATAGSRALADGDHAGARARLGAALDLWRGPALAEFDAEPFARTHVARLETTRLQALEDRLDADLALGRAAELVGELEAAVADHPLRERFWAQLMLALYRAGRQGDALHSYGRARELLADQLGVDPGPRLRDLHAAILRQDRALDLAVAARRPPRPEPPLTSFVGRERESAEVQALVLANRLVTLTGTGGVGKSRLALRVAPTCAPDFPGGTWPVELAALNQPGLVARAVAATLGVREHPQRSAVDVLADQVGSARTLVLLDNCEHLVAEVADVADRLLRACPGLHILATSRERLGITGEVLRPVAGLDVPPVDAKDAHEIGRAAAVRLLVERAAAVRPGLELTDANADAAAEVCRHLDGLPLAIELAAARANALRLDDIAARLGDRFRLLSHGSRTALPRHQTLRAVVDWSYELLDDAERDLFNRLAVFVGGFTLDSVEAVCGSVAERLARLVDKSLIVAGERYRMLETLRLYGLERLDESGHGDAVRGRHAAHVVAAVRAVRPALAGEQQAALLRRFEAELGNIRAALEWLIARGDAPNAVRLAGWLYPLWDRHGHYREGRRWFDRVLALDGPVPPAARARALDSAAGLAVIQGDFGQAAVEAEEAVALCRRAGDQAGLAQVLTTLGLIAIYAGETERAVSVLDEALGSARESGDHRSQGTALVYLAVAALDRGDYDATLHLCAECEAALRPAGDPESLAWASVLRGVAQWRVGDHAGSARSLQNGLIGFRSLEHVWGVSIGVMVSGQLARDPRRTVTLLAASEGLRESVGAALLPFAARWLDEALARAEPAIGPDDVRRAWSSGRAATLADAVSWALRELSEGRE